MNYKFFRKERLAAVMAVCFLWNLPVGWAADLSLQEAVSMALEQNPKLKLAQKSAEKAKVQLTGVKGQQRPALTASSSLGISDAAGQEFSRSNSNSIRLSMPLYTGGKNELNIAKAQDTVAVSELNLGRTQENLILETVVAYYKILEAEKIMNVNTETVRNYQAHLTNVENLYQAGSTPKVDLLRSEVELVNAQQNLLKTQNTYDVAVSTLKSLIKMNDDEILHLSDEANYIKFTNTLSECTEAARSNRKDLQQAQLAVSKAKKDVGIAASDKLPVVSLAVGSGWDKQVLPSGDDYSLNASVSASWNIFDSNVTNAGIKAAKIAVEEAELELEQQIDAVDLAVRENYLSMKEAEKRFNTTAVAVQKAQEDYYIATEKYKAGEGVMLDIIDAQLALSTAKSNYIQSQYDYATYKAKLENSMGISEVLDA